MQDMEAAGRPRRGRAAAALPAALALCLALAGCASGDEARSPAPVEDRVAGQPEAAEAPAEAEAPEAAAAAEPPPAGEEAPASAEEPAPAAEEETQVAALPPDGLQEEPLEPAAAAPALAVGILLPLSGGHGATGQALLDAAELALFEGGRDGVVLVPRHTGEDPETALAALEELRDEGVSVVVGPLFSRVAKELAPAAREAGILMLALTNDVSLAGDGVWALGRHPGEDVRRILAHARGLGRGRFGMLAPDTAYGGAALAAFREALPGGDAGFLLHSRSADPASVAQDFLAHSSVANAPDGAVIVASRGWMLRSLAAELAFRDIDPERVVLLGLSDWHDRGILGEPALTGGFFPASPEDAFRGFADRYARAYGRPATRTEGLAYDATSLAASLAAVPPERRRLALASDEGFQGTLGLFRLRDDGSVERGLSVYRVTREGFEVVAAAPSGFR